MISVYYFKARNMDRKRPCIITNAIWIEINQPVQGTKVKVVILLSDRIFQKVIAGQAVADGVISNTFGTGVETAQPPACTQPKVPSLVSSDRHNAIAGKALLLCKVRKHACARVQTIKPALVRAYP